MKNTILVFVFSCFTFHVYGQIFAPVGSKWVYCYAVNALGGELGYDTLVVESVAETHFDTLPCRELRVTYCYSWGSFGCGLVSKIIVCQDDKKIYYQEGDSLFLLHNFGLMPGDTLRIRYPIALDTFNQLAVDSAFYPSPSRPYFDILILDTTTLDLNGQKVWAQTFSEVGNDGPFLPSWYSGQFLEDIGSTAGWLFPRAINALQEEHIPMNLMSFKRPALSGNFLNLNPFCQTTSSKEGTTIFDIRVWPNPAKAMLNIKLPISGEAVQAQIFDVSGKMVVTASMRTSDSIQVNITGLKQGVYLFKVIVPNRGIATGRFIVE